MSEEVEGWEVYSLKDIMAKSKKRELVLSQAKQKLGSTWADLEAILPPKEEREREYRRGYRDGYIAATEQLYDIWFLGKQRAYDALWDHWQGKLLEWVRFLTDKYFPPRCVIECVYCGKQAHHLDHIHPKSKGGSNEDDNKAPACRTCNCRKRDKTLDEWQAYRARFKQNKEDRA